ncbi:unnamed protein product, partial [Symbiodinium sp. KB8]
MVGSQPTVEPFRGAGQRFATAGALLAESSHSPQGRGGGKSRGESTAPQSRAAGPRPGCDSSAEWPSMDLRIRNGP